MDILLTDIGDGGDTRFNNGDLATDRGFSTAIYISLFGGEMLADIFLPEPERSTKEFIEALQDVITMGNLRTIESKANKLLEWFINEGVIDSIAIEATSPEYNYIKIDITFAQSDEENKYTIFWNREIAGVARIVTN